MGIKLILYIIMLPCVIYSLDSININQFFKKNKVIQARILYIMISLALTYIIVNFINDFLEVSKIL